MADILLAEEAVCAVALEAREGLVSCGLNFLDRAASATAGKALVGLARAGGLLGEGSREFKGEEEAVDV